VLPVSKQPKDDRKMPEGVSRCTRGCVFQPIVDGISG
jgi:hypothetical protein